MATLGRAIAIAAEAHDGQKDKAGEAYILHPLRLMLGLSGETERIAAILHDVVEDSDWELEELRREGFSDDVIQAVDHLTRRDDETYLDFVRRAKRHPIARVVKRADLEDNMDLSRIENPTERDRQRLARYEKALAILNGAGPGDLH